MSMTQVAIFRKENLPGIRKVETDIQNLGYKFQFSSEANSLLTEEGLECTINECQTYFETYIGQPQELTKEFDFIKPDLSNEDIALSFIWGRFCCWCLYRINIHCINR